MERVLIVEDEKGVVELLRESLTKAGFKVTARFDGASGLKQLRKSPPDVLVLDLGLPKLSGLDVLKAVKQDPKLGDVMVLILSGTAEEADRVVGLELGADDYVPKPFSPRELVARIRALLRRARNGAVPPKAIQVGSLQIDPSLRRVTLDGRHIPTSAIEFRLLYFLATHPNQVFSREELLEAVWGKARNVTVRSVDTYFWRLRRKLERNPQNPALLKSSRGTGYLLEIPPSGERSS